MNTVQRAVTPAYRLRIGNREIVGPSFSGKENYIDAVDQPCPAIRFKEPTPEINALREKEKGSWKALSIEEKKRLYRFSFCQTFKELEAPRAQGRFILGTAMMLISVPIVLYAVMKNTIFPPLPETMSDKGKKQLVRWYIDAKVEPMEGGISSKWDYEKNQWKEKPFMFMRNK